MCSMEQPKQPEQSEQLGQLKQLMAAMRDVATQTILVWPEMRYGVLHSSLDNIEQYLYPSGRTDTATGCSGSGSGSGTGKSAEDIPPSPSHKSILTLLCRIVKRNLHTFAVVREALDASVPGLCAWADFLDCLLVKIVGSREHLMPRELDMQRFLDAQRLLATVYVTRERALYVPGWIRMEMSLGKKSCFEVFANQVASFVSDAKEWWVVGEADRELDEHAWGEKQEEWCVHTRKALLTAAQRVVRLASCRRFFPVRRAVTTAACERAVLSMAAKCTPDVFSGEERASMKGTGWHPAYVLLSDPVTGSMLERLLSSVLVDVSESEQEAFLVPGVDFPWEVKPFLKDVVDLLADVFQRPLLEGDVVSRAVCGLSTNAASVMGSAIFEVLTEAQSAEAQSDMESRPYPRPGARYPRFGLHLWPYPVTHVRFWWCVDSTCSDKEALTRWRSIVLEGLLTHLREVISGIVRYFDFDNVDDEYQSLEDVVAKAWARVKEEAMMIAYETGRAREVRGEVRAALAALPAGAEFARVCGGLEDLLQLCKGVEEWSCLRGAWLGAVHRGGKAREAARREARMETRMGRMGSGSGSEKNGSTSRSTSRSRRRRRT